MICIWKRERERQTGEIKTGRGLILPALFSGVRLRRPRVCQRSRRAGRCTDSSLHAGRLLFTKEKKKKRALLFHWLPVVTRLRQHGAFTGLRDDSDEDYIYQPVSSGVNCASMWAEPRVSGVSPFFFSARYSRYKTQQKQKKHRSCPTFLSSWKLLDRKRRDITPGSEGLTGF